ncbi:MAG: hypothetical protein MHMPM18_004924 [Marteilia pararefringens]
MSRELEKSITDKMIKDKKNTFLWSNMDVMEVIVEPDFISKLTLLSSKDFTDEFVREVNRRIPCKDPCIDILRFPELFKVNNDRRVTITCQSFNELLNSIETEFRKDNKSSSKNLRYRSSKNLALTLRWLMASTSEKVDIKKMVRLANTEENFNKSTQHFTTNAIKCMIDYLNTDRFKINLFALTLLCVQFNVISNKVIIS